MAACMCLLPFASTLDRLGGITPAIVRREWSKLPTSCMDARCSPGGCRKNCTDFAAGVVQRLNSRKPDTKPPKSKGKKR